MIPLLLVFFGTWILQDALASICFYGSNEKWCWNHMARLVRASMGIALIIIGGFGL